VASPIASNQGLFGPPLAEALVSVFSGAVDCIKGASMRFFICFVRDETAATAVEYAVMLALIIGTCLGAISFFGGEAGGSWRDTSDRIDSAMNGAS
jgi:pilus assembly protein Flp/PilA